MLCSLICLFTVEFMKASLQRFELYASLDLGWGCLLDVALNCNKHFLFAMAETCRCCRDLSCAPTRHSLWLALATGYCCCPSSCSPKLPLFAVVPVLPTHLDFLPHSSVTVALVCTFQTIRLNCTASLLLAAGNDTSYFQFILR